MRCLAVNLSFPESRFSGSRGCHRNRSDRVVVHVTFTVKDPQRAPGTTCVMTVTREHDLNMSFSIRIALVPSDDQPQQQQQPPQQNASVGHSKIVPQHLINSFRLNGFVVFPDVTSDEAVDALNNRLEDILRGSYDRGSKPDKSPRLVKGEKPGTSKDPTSTSRKQKNSLGPIGFSGNLQNVKVLQIINVHKADSLFRKLATNHHLGSLVAQLAGWKTGARLAQDQVWAKPPGAPPLVFHRDSPYFMFEPDDVVTVWFALDDMEEELGPLEYVKGSHRWGDGRVGSASQFFQQNGKSLLWSAAEREGINPDDLEIVSMRGLKRGGMSIHHGRCWHGSGENKSKSKPRRGLGIHFVPANVRFTAEASHSKLWKSYVADVEDPAMVELSDEDFPVTA